MKLDHEARVALTEQMLLEAVTVAEMPITGDLRIREADAASLLGFSPGYLKTLREAGTGPEYYGIGVGGGTGTRLSYRLSSLARWIENRRGEDAFL